MKAYLTEREEKSTVTIVKVCNAFDRTVYSVPLDADLYYLSSHDGVPVGFLAAFLMGDTVDSRPVEEVMLFVRPDFRRHGRGRKLFRRYMEDAAERYGRAPVIRFSAYPSEVSSAFLEKLGAVYSHDEVLMRRHLGTNDGKELEEREFRMENAFSECSVKTYGTVGYIYGVRTDAGHLRQGSAEKLLNDVFAKLYELGAEDAVLEVSSANVPAYHLYQKLQFEVRESLQIWNLL